MSWGALSARHYLEQSMWITWGEWNFQQQCSSCFFSENSGFRETLRCRFSPGIGLAMLALGYEKQRQLFVSETVRRPPSGKADVTLKTVLGGGDTNGGRRQSHKPSVTNV